MEKLITKNQEVGTTLNLRLQQIRDTRRKALEAKRKEA